MEHSALLDPAGGGDTLAALTCICTSVGGCRSSEPEESPAEEEASPESIPSGGVIGDQNCDTEDTGAV